MAKKRLPLERKSKGPVVTVVWDGFGISKLTEGNPVVHAAMPTWRRLTTHFPYTLLGADGEDVGLPKNQPGNSEAGHATIGAGRPVESDQVRIDRSIDDKTFEDNPALLKAAAHCIRNKTTLHLMGLLTANRSGHASPKHLRALVKFATGIRLPRIALHLFTDGRDTPPFHAAHLIAELEKTLPKHVVISTVSGRFYAMDRNRFWERTALAYEAITSGEGVMAESAIQAVTQAYNRGESDEFITPTVICKNNVCVAPVSEGDAVIFWNLRSDRARQLTKPFVMRDFETREPHAFQRHHTRRRLCFVTLTEFGSDLDSVVPAFPNREISGTIVEALRYQHQLYASESEKFSQVTYFLNGGFDRPRFTEERLKVSSPRVARYDHTPRMRADELAHRVAHALDGGYDFVLVNFCNADMIAHTGNESAAVKACEALDDALGVLWKKIQRLHGTLIVTADHGNVEQMHGLHGGVDTEHNPNPVPFLAAGTAVSSLALRRGSPSIHPAARGTLADIAPTALWLLGIDQPREMTGRRLLN